MAKAEWGSGGPTRYENTLISEAVYLQETINKLKEEKELLKDFLGEIGMDCNSIVEALKHIKENNDKTIQISKGSA